MVFIDVVAKTIEERDFDGKVFLERVVNEEEYKKRHAMNVSPIVPA